MDKEAESIAIGAEKLIYLPYLMGERTPHLDSYARGVFFGLSPIHTKKHMIRAVMEGVSYSLRDCIEVFREMRIDISDMAACGGGGTSQLWRSMLADIYGCTVSTVDSKEGAALGSAILAMVACEMYASVTDACKAVVRTDKVQYPNKKNAREYEKYYSLYKKLYPLLKSGYRALSLI